MSGIQLKIRQDVPLAAQCGHGKLWTEFCPDCRIANLEHSLGWMEPRVKRDRAELEKLQAELSAAPVDSVEES